MSEKIDKEKLNIREISALDETLYLRMAKDFYSSEGVLQKIPNENFSRAFDELMRSKTYAECFIIEVSGVGAGYCLLAKTFSQESGGPVVWIEELYIREAHQNKGIGIEVMRFIERRFPNATAFRAEIEPNNEHSLGMAEAIGYKKMGYEPIIKLAD